MKQINLSFLFIILISIIGVNVFSQDFKFKNTDGVTIYYSIENDNEVKVNYNKSLSWPHASYSGNVVIPPSVTYNEKNYRVVKIGAAFENCSGLTAVTIPNSVTNIGGHAFEGTGLKFITIPNSVTHLGHGVFYGCKDLTYIDIPSSVSYIGVDAFSYTAWYDNQPEGLIYAGKVVLNYKGNIPPNTILDIKDGTLGIAGSAFSGDSEYDIQGIISVNIPNSMKNIGDDAFSGCERLTSLRIPHNVISIGARAFEHCTNLSSVILGKSVTSIGEKAFYECSKLESLYCYMVSPTSLGSAFDLSHYANTTLYVPKGTKSKYQNTEGWRYFQKIEEFDVNAEQEETPVNLSVMLSSAGYATFYNDSRNFKLPAGVSALVLTSESGQTLNYKTIANGDANGIVPKGVPVILVSSNRRGGTYTLTSTTESASYSGENLLHGSSSQTVTSNVNGVSTSGNSNYVYYKLAYGKSGSVNANKLGWYWGANNGAAFTIAGGKAWLALPKSSAQSLDAILLEEDDATSIDGIEQSNMNEANDAQYNMAGQRVGNGYNGIIIVNGKKVIR